MRVLAALAVLFLAGCATSEQALESDAIDGTDDLVAYLEGRGFTLIPEGLTTSTIPLTTTVTYRVTGVASPAVMEVFEFESEDAARAGLIQLRSEIRPRVRRDVYARGALVVRLDAAEYRQGTSASLKRALAQALGGVQENA